MEDSGNHNDAVRLWDQPEHFCADGRGYSRADRIEELVGKFSGIAQLLAAIEHGDQRLTVLAAQVYSCLIRRIQVICVAIVARVKHFIF